MVCVQIEEANAAEHQDQSPDPAAMEVSHELEQIAEAETEEQDRQKISASAESKEGRVAEPGADRPDPVESGGVGVGGIGRDILFIIGKESDERQHRDADQHDADDVAEAARVDLALRCVASHASRLGRRD